MKAQASVEFITVVGIALVLAAPFVVESQSMMIDIGFGSEVAEIQASLDDVARTVRKVGAMDKPARKQVELRLTRDMEDFQVSEDRAITYSLERSGEEANFTRIFDQKINAENMPTEQGVYTLNVEAYRDRVNISRAEP
ncbi:MAG: hypothetical protein ACLFTA_02985 [Candidatus Nanohaloarchaea archaeon]